MYEEELWDIDAGTGIGMGWGDLDTSFGNQWASGGGIPNFGSNPDPFTSTGGGGGSGGGFLSDLLGGINISFPTGGGGTNVNDRLTGIVNAAERALQYNLGAWQSNQLAAQDAIARAWDILNSCVQQLYAYGAAGQKSAAERDRRIDPTLLRWDWIAYYIDPINGGPTAPVDLPAGVNAPTGGNQPPYVPLSPVGGNTAMYLGIGALALIAVIVLTGKR